MGALQGLGNLNFMSVTDNMFDVESSSVFQPLKGLQEIHTDAYRYCCMVRKHQDVDVCTPLADPFSSCEDLMANQVLRWSIWVLGISAFLGNIFVIIWRVKQNDLNKVPSFLIWNLALADFLMGIYMLIIASVDVYYRGVYVTYDAFWKNSFLCKFAGFLASLSSEVSVFTLTVITLDRFLIIVFPLKFIRIKLKTATLIVLIGWIVVAVLSFLPLVGIPYFGDNYYGRSPVCLSLHLTNERTPGWEFSVIIFLFANFLSFILIFACYVAMYISVKFSTTAAGVSSQRNTKNAMKIAKRMTLIVLTDFCCWVPITVMGILALTDTVTIPGSVYAWTAVFILPVNSAMNPILYTISVIKVKKRLPRSSIPVTMETSKKSSEWETAPLIHDTMRSNPVVPGDLMASYFASVTPLKKSQKLLLGKITINEVHVIAVDIAKSLDFLHDKRMTHGCVSEESVCIAIDVQGNICRAFLSDLSRSRHFGNDRRLPYTQDMTDFGNLISRLIGLASQ
ncbi:G-protein coupled receptor GRL101-like [Ptychodera flava]|uniref:G-protein coupled receptor GRL101-like n=1 Tax=Ptychodera flava TaxID=63121 RepID=UPI00396A80B6